MMVSKVFARRGWAGETLARVRGLSSLSVAGALLAGTAMGMVPARAAAQTVDLGGGSVSITQAADFAGVTLYTNGTVTLAPGSAFGFGNPLIFTPIFDDSLGVLAVTKTGVNAILLATAGSTHSGLTTLGGGLVVAGAENVLSPNSRLVVNSSGRLDLNGFSQTVAALQGAVPSGPGTGFIANTSPNAAVLTVVGNQTATLASRLTETDGVISVVLNGTGVQGFSNAENNFSGGVTLNSGTLRYGAPGSLGTGVLTVGGAGAIINPLSGGTSLTNNVLLNAGVTFASPNASVWTGVVSGVGGITVQGTSTRLTLSNSGNSFSGGITGNGGRIYAGADNAFGTGVFTVNATTVSGTLGNNSAAIGNDIVLNAQLNLDLPTLGNAFRIDGDITGAAGIFVHPDGGAGQLQLFGDNSFNGNVLASVGSVGIGSNTALGNGRLQFGANAIGLVALVDGLVVDNAIASNLPASGAHSIDTQSFTLTLNGNLRNSGGGNPGRFAKIGDGTLVMNGNVVTTNGMQVDAGTLRLNGSVTNNLDVNAGATLTGTGSVGGNLTVSGGTIAPGASPGTLPVGGNFVLDAGSLLDIEVQTPGVLGMGVNDLITVAGNLTLDGTALFTPLPGFSLGTFTFITYGGALTDNGLIVTSSLPGVIDFTLVDPSTTPGQVQVTATFNAPALLWDGDGMGNAANGVVDGGSGTWNDLTENWTITSGLINLAWINGVVAEFGGASSGTVTVDGEKIIAGLNFVIDGYELVGDALTFTPGIRTVDVATGTASIANDIGGVGSTLQKTGDGLLVLTGTNGYTGGTLLTAGAIEIGNSSALGSGALTMSGGTTLRAGVDGLVVVNDVALLDGTANFIDNNGSTAFTLDGVISGDGPLRVINSPGADLGTTLILNGINTYVGSTIVEGTTVQIAADSGLGAAANALVLDEGQLRTTADITTARAVELLGGFGQFDVADATTLTANGLVSGSGELSKVGTGTLVLGNAGNDFAGDVVIRDGTVQVGSEGALGAGNIRFEDLGGTLALTAGITTAKTVQLLADGTIDTIAGDSTFTGVISGPASLTKEGPAMLTLTGVNTYEGGTFLNQGTLRISNDDAIGTGTLTTQDGTTFTVGIANNAVITLANDIVFETGTTTIDFVGNLGLVNASTGATLTTGTTLTLNGTISGDGGFVSQNFGTVALNGDNSYAGGTELFGVAAFVGTNTALGTGTVTLGDFASVQNNSGGALTLANDFQINATPGFGAVIGGSADLTLTGEINGGGVLDKAGTNVVTVTSGTSGFSGVLNVNNGEFRLGAGAVFGDGVQVTNVGTGATLSGVGTIVGTVNMANFSILSPGNSPGTLTIDGDLNLSNDTILEWELGQAYALGGALNDRVIVTGNLVLDGLLTVTQPLGGTFGLGVYNLFSYDTLTDNGVTILPLPGGFNGFIQNNTVASQINLIVAGPGVFIQQWDGPDQLGNGQIDGGDGVWSLANFNWTGEAPSELNTSWQQNSVGVFQGTAGTVQVADDFQFAGLSFLVDGYTLTDGGGSLNIATQSFIHTDTGVTTTIAAPITGAGELLKQGAGTLALNGDNSYAGGTGLQQGTIVVGTNTALGTGALTMANLTTLAAGVDGIELANAVVTAGVGTIDTDSFTLTLDGVVSGAGSIVKVGDGTLVLNGNNLYAGGTALQAGTITVGTSTALGTGALTASDGTSLVAGVDALNLANAVLLNGGLTVDSGTGSFELSGVIGGAGSLTKVNSGNLILSADNGYAGGTALQAGTITVGTSTALGTGTLTASDGTSLVAGTDGLNVANAVLLNGGLTVDSGTGSFELSGVIGGAGSLTKVNSGNLILSGANGYAGGTLINDGILQVNNSNAAGTGVITIGSQTALSAGADGIVLANDIVTPGVGVIYANGFTFTLNGDISGPGSINLMTAGNLVLNGDNSFTGLGISVGRVTLGSNTAAGIEGIILNDDAGTGAALAAGVDGLEIANSVLVNQLGVIDTADFTFTINGTVSGDGSIEKVGSGNLVLNGDNSFGGLTLTAGTTTLGTATAGGSGTISIGNATLAAGVSGLTVANALNLTGASIINSGAGTLALSGVISGAGSLNKQGAGILTLSGVNTYTGGTTISAGTLTITGGSALGTGAVTFAGGNLATTGGTFTLANNAVFNTAGGIDTAGGTLTMSGVLSGAGQVQKLGNGTLILTGTNTYTGGTLVSGGTLQGNSASFGTGPITNNANLVFNQMVNGTFGQAISGTGTLTKTGAAQLILSGTSTYTGATTVAQGDLNVTGSIGGSTVTVQNGARLQGTGTVGGIVAQSGSRIQPGNAVGTLTVNGPVTFQAGSFYDVDVTAAGADRITATGALTLAGTMAVAPTGSFGTFNQTFTVASGSARTGTFSTVTGLAGFGVAFNPLVDYTANSVLIRLAPASLVGLAGSNVRPNGLEVARAFDRAVAAGVNPQAFFPLYALGTSVGPALEQFTGEIHSAQRRVAMEDSRVVRETAFDRLNAAPSSRSGTQSASMSKGGGELTYWLRAAGSWGTAGQDSRGTRFTTEQLGFLTGLDYAQDGFTVGAGFTYTQNEIEMAALGNGRVRSTGGVAYAGYRDASGFALGIGGSVAGIRASSSRGISVPGLSQGLRSNTDGQTYQLFGELSYDIAAGDKATVTPFGRYAYVNTRGNAFGETGGVAAITGARQSFDISVIQAGLRSSVDVGGNASLMGSLAYQNISGDRAPLINLGIQGLNQLMPIATTALDRDSVAVEAKVNVGIGNRAAIGVGYNGVIGNRNNDHGARATLTIGF